MRHVVVRSVNAWRVVGRVVALDLQEAVCGVTDAGRQDLVVQHGVDHRALAVARAAEEDALHAIARYHPDQAVALLLIALQVVYLFVVDQLTASQLWSWKRQNTP